MSTPFPGLNAHLPLAALAPIPGDGSSLLDPIALVFIGASIAALVVLAYLLNDREP